MRELVLLFGKIMVQQPIPPDGLPQYLAEGVPKQDDDTLRELQEWIHELLDYRQDVAADEIEVDEGEQIQDVQESSSGTVVIKKVSCGKENCKCQRGELHGPYKYVVRRKGGKLEWDYRGPVSG